MKHLHKYTGNIIHVGKQGDGCNSMKILELFCGTKSISKAFEAKGHEIFTVDIDKSFNPDLCTNIEELTTKQILKQFGQPDIIWASPPCTCFSVASIGTHWTGGKGAYIPKTQDAVRSMNLVRHTLKLIGELKPTCWFIENPRGVLRKMPFMMYLPYRHTVTYCQYGDSRMKPTDIWTNHPNPQFNLPCKNGSPCHEAAPRGSKTGTQGLKGAKERGIIPRLLCEHVCKVCEEGKGVAWRNC